MSEPDLTLVVGLPAPYWGDPTLDESTPVRIKRLRSAAGLSQPQFAAAIGKSVSWVGKVECGDIIVDRVSVLAGLAAALGVSPLALIATRLRDLRR